MTQRALPYVWLLLLISAQLIAALIMNHGAFFYALDDAYIHLEFARHIHNGHVGLQAGELASPASSIAWPLLLSVGADLPFFSYLPFALNILCAFASVRILHHCLDLVFSKHAKHYSTAILLAQCALIVGLNLAGLCFIGMEHGLQLLCALFMMHQLLRKQLTGECSSFIWFVIFVAPLVRYECLSISGIALLWLMTQGHFLRALLTGLCIIGALASYSLFLIDIGLPTLPLSVLVKQASMHLLPGGPILLNLMQPAAWVMLSAMGLLLWTAYKHHDRSLKLLCVGTAFVVLTHLIFGMVGVRYDAYLWGFMIPLLLLAYRAVISRFLNTTRPVLMHVRITIALAGLLAPYSAYSLYDASVATHNIASMQGQMHRFVTEIWKAPIAVNDVGLISYNNPHYVLDVVGLSNAKAHALNRPYIGAPNRKWLAALSDQYQVQIAFLFESWFRAHLPEHWVHVASLHMDCCNVTLPETSMAIYATSEDFVHPVHHLLKRFESRIGQGARLTFIAQPMTD